MSKKKSRWIKRSPKPQPVTAETAPVGQAILPARDVLVPPVEDFSAISPAQLAANRSNALLSTGPRTQAGFAKSSQNAIKSGLTGRTVLLPTDDVEEYSTFLAEFQRELKPVGARECELVQIIVDCHWRLRRIQELEYALYAHGEEQFAPAFADLDPLNRHSKIVLQTHLTYQKELRNLHIQESRIDRKRRNALAELEALQIERRNADSTESPAVTATAQTESRPQEAVRYTSSQLPHPETLVQNGFVFSNASSEPAINPESSAS